MKGINSLNSNCKSRPTRNIEKIICLVLLLPTLQMKGQEHSNDVPKHEIGIAPFRIEANSATHNAPFVAKAIFGIYYQRDLGTSNFSWYSLVDYGLNRIDDDCNDCVVRTYGTGFITEFNALTGISYFPFKRKLHRILPFVQTNLNFAMIRYEGFFTINDLANQSGTRMVVGPSFRLGFSTLLFHDFILSTSAGMRYGAGSFRGKYLQYPSIPVEDLSFTLLQLSIGYCF